MLQINCIGNIGNDATINETNGRKVISFSIAENTIYKDKEGVKHEKTTWVNCSLWKDKKDESKIAAYLTKGTKVFVQGIPEIQIWKDKDQTTKAGLHVTVKQVELLTVKENEVKV